MERPGAAAPVSSICSGQHLHGRAYFPHPSSASWQDYKCRGQRPESQPCWSPQEEAGPVTPAFNSATGAQASYRRARTPRRGAWIQPSPKLSLLKGTWDIQALPPSEKQGFLLPLSFPPESLPFNTPQGPASQALKTVSPRHGDFS